MLRDNFDFWDEYDRRQAKLEKSLPVCDCCGEHMSEWYEVSYKRQTWMFCKSCVTEKYWEE